MLSYRDIRTVHLEVTDKCNANCPMCARSINGGPLNPNLRMIEMSLSDAKLVFPGEFLKQLRFIQLCGNFGDPIVAKDTVEILRYFRSENPNLPLGMHTNGSARTPEWWAQLGEILSRPGDYCKFGLDGLADTNHIYRRNTNWDKIMANVKSFIQAGGEAHWEFLVFKHNEHQVEDARNQARELGFKEFYLKKTSRFFDYKQGVNIPFPIYDKQMNVIDHLYPPDSEDFVNPVSRFQDEKPVVASGNTMGEKMQKHVETAVQNSSELIKSFGTLDKYLAETGIDCMSSRDQSVYITARGEIYPCCFLGGQVQYSDPGPDGASLERLKREAKGELGISGLNQKVESIVDEGWFPGIRDSWSEPQDSPKAINTCRRMCGKNLQLVAGEYA